MNGSSGSMSRNALMSIDGEALEAINRVKRVVKTGPEFLVFVGENRLNRQTKKSTYFEGQGKAWIKPASLKRVHGLS
jgi:hypothetical protein